MTGNLNIPATDILKTTPASIAIHIFIVVYLPNITRAASSKKCRVLIVTDTNPNPASLDLILNSPIANILYIIHTYIYVNRYLLTNQLSNIV